jgi:hypothetical protein
MELFSFFTASRTVEIPSWLRWKVQIPKSSRLWKPSTCFQLDKVISYRPSLHLLLNGFIFLAVSTPAIGRGYIPVCLQVCYWTRLFSCLSPGMLLDELILPACLQACYWTNSFSLPVSRSAIGRSNCPGANDRYSLLSGIVNQA